MFCGAGSCEVCDACFVVLVLTGSCEVCDACFVVLFSTGSHEVCDACFVVLVHVRFVTPVLLYWFM